jgi:hypothetical protein
MTKLIDPTHLHKVKESYWQHLRWAWWSAGVFALLVPLALLHGAVPWLFAGWPDRVLMRYFDRFNTRRQRTGQARKPAEPA